MSKYEGHELSFSQNGVKVVRPKPITVKAGKKRIVVKPENPFYTVVGHYGKAV